jgi:hypothetical protein
MRRRRTVIAVGALVVLSGLTGAVALLLSAPGRPGVSLTTMARVEPGMSEAEVEAVLGPPTADRTGRPPPRVAPSAAGGRLLEYAGERATAVVEFDPGGRAVRAWPVEVRTVTGVERVRLRLNWW